MTMAVVLLATAYYLMSDEARLPRAGDAGKTSDAIVHPVDDSADKLVINTTECDPGDRRVLFTLGATHFMFVGSKDNSCEFYMGTHIKNPNWDGTLATKCRVPTSEGTKEFTVTDNGIQFEDFLQTYCKDIAAR